MRIGKNRKGTRRHTDDPRSSVFIGGYPASSCPYDAPVLEGLSRQAGGEEMKGCLEVNLQTEAFESCAQRVG
jgi:hypothetical protein